MKVIISEKQNVNSVRDGLEYDVPTMKYAKWLATRNQAFQGTVMVIETLDGEVLSVKTGNKWKDSI